MMTAFFAFDVILMRHKIRAHALNAQRLHPLVLRNRHQFKAVLRHILETGGRRAGVVRACREHVTAFRVDLATT